MNIRAAIGGLLFFAAFGAAQPAAAAGCTGNPDITIFTLTTNTKYQLRFYVWRDGDKIRGKMYFNPRPGDAGGEGSVDGQFFPPSGIFMRVFLYPPAPTNTQLLISGDFFKGDGRGQLKQTNWGADVPQTIWSAETVEGCPKWPDDPQPPKPEPVNILTTDQCEAAAQKSLFPSHMGATHPCNVRTTSGTVSADVLNALDNKESLTRDNGWTTPLFGGGDASGNPVPAGAFPCRPGANAATTSKSGLAVGQKLMLVGLKGFDDCLPRYPRGAGTLPPGPVTKLTPPTGPGLKREGPRKEKPIATAPPASGPVSRNDAMDRLGGGGASTPAGSDTRTKEGRPVPCATCSAKSPADRIPPVVAAPPPRTVAPSGPAPNIDYGGCSGCGRGTFTAPK